MDSVFLEQSRLYSHIKSILHRYPFAVVFCCQIFIYLMPSYLLLTLLILLIIAISLIKVINLPTAIIYIAFMLIFFYQIRGQNITPIKWHYGSITGNVETFSSIKNNIYSFIIKSDKTDYWVRSPRQAYYSDTIKITGRVVPLSSSCNLNPTFSDFLRSKGISGTINADYIKIIKRGKLEFIDIFRNNLAKRFKRWLINPDIASSLVLGMPAPKPLYKKFQKAGVSHLLAVSGIHLGFFLIFFGFILNLIIHNIPYIYENFDTRRIIATILLFASLFFIYFTGLRVSAVRAFFMAVVYFVSIIIRRPFSGLNALFIAASFLGIIMPSDFLSAGFILSVAGTAFAMILYKKIAAKNKIIRIIIFYILIFILMFPLQLHFFGLITPISPISNLVIVPLVEIIIIPSLQIFSVLITAAPHSALIVPASNLINTMFKILSFLVNLFDHFIYINIFKTDWLMILLFYFALFLLVFRNLKYRYILFSLTIASLAFFITIKLSPTLYIISSKKNFSVLATKGETAWLVGNIKIYKIKGVLNSEGIKNIVSDIHLKKKLGPFYIKKGNGKLIVRYGKINIKISKHTIFLQNGQIPMPKMALLKFLPYPHISVCK